MHARRLASVPALLSLLLLPGPASAQEPRWCHGVLLTFDSSRSVLTLQSPGTPARSVSFARPPEPFDALLIRDYVLRPDQRLLVSAAGLLPGQGGAANLVLELDGRDLSRPAQVRNTGPVVCWVLEAADNGFWCLGPDMPALLRGQDYGVLYRYEDGNPDPRPVLRRGQLPRDSAQSPWAGSAQLLALPGGGVLAWMPGVEKTAEVMDAGVRIRPLPLKIPPHAITTVAVDAEGLLHALMPLSEPEKLDTPYGLFCRSGGRWLRLSPGMTVPRGSRLLAVDGRNGLVIDRRLLLLALPIERAATPAP